MPHAEMPTMKKRITVEEADNGFLVSMYDDKGEKKLIAKTMDEVHAAVSKLMGGKSEKEKTKELGNKVVAHT